MLSPVLLLSGILLSATTFNSQATVSVTDSDGREIRIEKPAARIVSLAPHATELLFAAGAGGKIVGVSEYSDYPEAARRLPKVSGSAGVDIERVLALRPDLVVAWKFEATRGALGRLEKLGVPVFISEPRQFAQIANQIEALGALAGTEKVARAEALRLREGIAALGQTYRKRTPVRVFYQIGERPLMTLNGEHLVTEALALCGARNVFADAQTIAPVVSPEAVLAADPDMIISGRRGAAEGEWRAKWKKLFPGMRAVSVNRMATVDSDLLHRQGPRIVAGTRILCERIDAARGP